MNVNGDTWLAGRLSVRDSLNIGAGGLFSSGPISVSVASSTQTNAVSVYFQGFVGIATTSPSRTLSVAGSTYLAGPLLATSSVQFSNFGAGTLSTDASGNITVSSDERLKDIEGDFTAGLVEVEKLDPILYKWKPETGYDASTTYAGFSAQNVRAAIPEAVGQDKDGYLTLQDRPLIAALVNAIKEIATISGAFKDNIIAFLGSASNGITDLFAAHIHANQADLQKLCTTRSDGTQVCITNDQLAALLSQAGASNLPPSVTSSHTSQVTNSESSGKTNSTTTDTASTPPVISISGENPAAISVGATYADLGATITSPQADLNLGLTVVVDNATSTDGTVQIDTSTPGTHTILYTVTDPSGLTGSATRTVIVSAPQQATPPANDNTTPSSAVNDNNQTDGATGTSGQ